MKRLYRVFLIGSILGLFLSYFAQANPVSMVPLSQDAKTALSRGDHVIHVWRDKSRTDKALDVFGAIDIAASPETIWHLMTDCARAKDIVNQMTLCQVLETAPDGSWDIRKQKIKIGFLLPKSVSVFRSDYQKPHTIRISLVGGNMKVQDGFWSLTPLGNGKTRVIYRAAVRPKFPVPAHFLKKGMRDDMPAILINLRRMSESEQSAQNTPKPPDHQP